MTDAPALLPLQGRRVLVIEDEYVLADELCLRLERLGAAVVGPAARVADALRLIQREGEAGLDGGILDVNLDGEKVFPVAEALRQRGVPFVFLTGYDAWALPETYKDVPRCEKPADMRRLAAMLFR